MKLDIMLEVDETFTTMWLSRSSEVRVKVRRWPQSHIGTILGHLSGDDLTWSRDAARMANCTAPVVKLTLTLILPDPREWDSVLAHATAAERAIIWQKQALLP